MGKKVKEDTVVLGLVVYPCTIQTIYILAVGALKGGLGILEKTFTNEDTRLHLQMYTHKMLVISC